MVDNRDGGGVEAGEATAGRGAFFFCGLGNVKIDLATGRVGDVTVGERFAESGLVVEVALDAPIVIGGDEAEGETGGLTEGILEGPEKLRIANGADEVFLERGELGHVGQNFCQQV